MKICVYSIAKNEEQHVHRWYESAKDADVLLIGDTGSSDNTIQLSKELGITTVELDIPEFRFDVAKNELLKHVDADVYINLDLDETLLGDWRSVIEKNYPFDILNVRYRRPNGESKSVSKIHNRNVRWYGSIHEFLSGGSTKRSDLVLYKHTPDLTKDRSNYLDMLRYSVYNEFYDENRAFNLYQYALMLRDRKQFGEAYTILQAAAYECIDNSPSNFEMIKKMIQEMKNEC